MTADAIREALNRYDNIGLQAKVWIGPAPMPKGYALDWLAWLDAYKARRNDRSGNWRTIWFAVAALVAISHWTAAFNRGGSRAIS
jgi:hypothetical protein